MTQGASSLPRQHVRAVLFDLDDTLLASQHLESIRRTRNQAGLDEALPSLSAPPQLHDQLRRLGQHLPLGVVTTSPRWYAQRLLSHLYPDIQWRVIVTYGDVQHRKPDPQGLLMAVRQLGLTPSTQVAYVGDQESDLEAARRAGLLPIQAAWCRDAGAQHELYVKDPADLAALCPVEGPVSATGERLLALLQLPGVGRTTVLNTLSRRTLEIGEASGDPRIARALQQAGAWEKAQAAAQEIIASCRATGIRILCPADPGYPAALQGMHKEMPALLFVQGSLSALPGMAVVGTREPTTHGLEVTRRVTTHFAADHSIVSGLALGVDSMAHQAALHAGGHTVAVLGHGHGPVSPRQNAALAEAILSGGGALVSEYPPGTPAVPHYFVERDRIQAGLARATILVQTDLQGGSWHAARKSLLYRRALGYPVPTERDKARQESKVQGIQLLEHGTVQDKKEQLNCQETDLHRVYRIGGKSDYDAFAAFAEAVSLEEGGAISPKTPTRVGTESHY